MNRTFIVRNENDLHGIAQLRRSKVEMAISRFDLDRNRELEVDINRQLGECGCRMSALFLVGSCTLVTAIDGLAWRTVSSHLITTAGINLVVAILLAGVGKLFGIAMARWNLGKVTAGLIAELNASNKSGGTPVQWGGAHGLP